MVHCYYVALRNLHLKYDLFYIYFVLTLLCFFFLCIDRMIGITSVKEREISVCFP